MRKLTANEINEIADVFKATLEACTSSKTAKKSRAAERPRTAEGQITTEEPNATTWNTRKAPVDGEIVNLASLPNGTGICWPFKDGEYGNAFKTSRGWTGDYLMGSYLSSTSFAFSLALDDYHGKEPRFARGPYSSPAGSVTIEDEEELHKIFVEDKVIDFGSYKLYLSGSNAFGGDVIVVNGSSSFQVTDRSHWTDECWVRFEDGLGTSSPEGNAKAIAEYFPNFPLRFEVYPNPFVR